MVPLSAFGPLAQLFFQAKIISAATPLAVHVGTAFGNGMLADANQKHVNVWQCIVNSGKAEEAAAYFSTHIAPMVSAVPAVTP